MQSTDLISELPTHQDLNDLIVRTLRPNASEIREIVDRRTAVSYTHLDVYKRQVKEYINTGAPVGSKALSEALPFSVSSATIRNEMGELIGQGYLIQPHTSAGRIPSVKGFKLYVNGLASGKLCLLYTSNKQCSPFKRRMNSFRLARTWVNMR